MAEFSGFTPAAARFFRGLRSDNTRAYFDAHRAEYTALIREPMQALLAEAERRYGDGRVMRPNRDVRFSQDNTPYRTSASLWAGGVGGVYLQVAAEGIEVGGGLYEPTRDQLGRARAAIDTRPAAADALDAALDDLEHHGFEVAGPSLTTAPRGYPKDHPHIELLRLKHYAALASIPLGSPLEAILESWQQVEPLIEWAQRWVGPAERWP